jgi:hypothetical protein
VKNSQSLGYSPIQSANHDQNKADDLEETKTLIEDEE